MKKKSIPLQLIEEFERIYKKIPEFECKGLCQDSCGMVPMAVFEWHRLSLRHGKRPVARELPDKAPRCPFLTVQGQCQHHDIRPSLCRLFGAVDHPLMRCPHGCRPATYLTEEEGYKIVAEADALGFGPTAGQMEILLSATKDRANLDGAVEFRAASPAATQG